MPVFISFDQKNIHILGSWNNETTRTFDRVQRNYEHPIFRPHPSKKCWQLNKPSRYLLIFVVFFAGWTISFKNCWKKIFGHIKNIISYCFLIFPRSRYSQTVKKSFVWIQTGYFFFDIMILSETKEFVHVISVQDS